MRLEKTTITYNIYGFCVSCEKIATNEINRICVSCIKITATIIYGFYVSCRKHPSTSYGCFLGVRHDYVPFAEHETTHMQSNNIYAAMF